MDSFTRGARSNVRRAAFALVAISIIVVVGGVGAVPGVAGGSTQPSWTPPLALAGGGGEPSIKNPVDGKSVAYVSAPAGTGSNFWYVKQVHNPDGSLSFKPSLPVQPDFGTGGGDSDIALGNTADPQTGCAPIAYIGLHNIDLLDNFTTSHSSDCGRTLGLIPLQLTRGVERLQAAWATSCTASNSIGVSLPRARWRRRRW